MLRLEIPGKLLGSRKERERETEREREEKGTYGSVVETTTGDLREREKKKNFLRWGWCWWVGGCYVMGMFYRVEGWRDGRNAWMVGWGRERERESLDGCRESLNGSWHRQSGG